MRRPRWLQTWDRGAFDWQHYSPLRRQGLSHKEAISALERMWAERYPHLDDNGYPKKNVPGETA